MECSKDSDEFTQSIQALKEGSQKVSVPKFCPTRWSARLLTLSTLLAKYPTVLDALDTISDSSTGDAKSDAESCIRLMESSAFIVAVSVAQFVLSYLALVTKTLQAKQCDWCRLTKRWSWRKNASTMQGTSRPGLLYRIVSNTSVRLLA